MKFKEYFNLDIKGHLKVWTKNKDGKETIIYDDHNTIVDNAENIIRRCISGDVHPIDNIAAYKAAVLLATKVVGADERTLISTDAFNFTTIFTFDDFNDTLDELRLVSSLAGTFSEVTGLSISKDSTEQLGVSWTITISI